MHATLSRFAKYHSVATAIIVAGLYAVIIVASVITIGNTLANIVTSL
jgi:hypothetical protein